MREYTYVQKNWQKIRFVAEGIIDGKVVATTTKMPSRRSTKLRLYVDHEGTSLVADGSDFVTVVAEVTDDNGNVKRLAKENILFSVEGEEPLSETRISAPTPGCRVRVGARIDPVDQNSGKITVKARVLFEGHMLHAR